MVEMARDGERWQEMVRDGPGTTGMRSGSGRGSSTWLAGKDYPRVDPDYVRI